jgi:sugar lactone lactonase YvrE
LRHAPKFLTTLINVRKTGGRTVIAQAEAPAALMSPDAKLLHPLDDVATALRPLRRGEEILAPPGPAIVLREDVPFGHKISVRPLSAGIRIRKHGEYIGRLTRDLEAGEWVHEHNLATTARRSSADVSRKDETAVILESFGPRCTVGESPVWDERTGRFYWVDVRETPAVFVLDRNSGTERRFPMQEDIGSLVLAEDGPLVLALRSGFAWFDPDTGQILPIVDPEPDTPQTRLNDAKCDAAGRVWCGSMNPESGRAQGRFYRLDPNGSCSPGIGSFLTPNGPVFSLDGSTLYLADTRKSLIYAYDYELASGSLGEARVFADLGAFPGGPDGATLDAEGYLWSAQWDGGCLLRFDPDGNIDRIVTVPVSKPTSCCFGGPEYGQLFVTTATRGLSEERRRAEPLAGRVMVLDVGVRGFAPARFGAARAQDAEVASIVRRAAG